MRAAPSYASLHPCSSFLCIAAALRLPTDGQQAGSVGKGREQAGRVCRENHGSNSPHWMDATERQRSGNKMGEGELYFPEDCTGGQAAATGTRGSCCGNGNGPAGAGTAKGRQSRRRGQPAAPTARTGQGGGASPRTRSCGPPRERGEGITRPGEER